MNWKKFLARAYLIAFALVWLGLLLWGLGLVVFLKTIALSAVITGAFLSVLWATFHAWD